MIAYRMVRTWKTGDEIALEFEYLLKTHVVTPKDDPVWVAFTYGPLALAQTTNDGVAVAEPFIGEDVRSTSVSQWFEPQSPNNDAVPKFRIRNTESQLGPFYAAGSDVTGPHTYFRISVVEVFVNGKQCVAMRVYPGRNDSLGVSLRSQGADAELHSLDAWQMANIYQE